MPSLDKGPQAEDDLIQFNSDLATVHIDTPWMNIVLQVRQNQNKVKTEKACVHAGMNVWITNLSPGMLEDECGGVLGEDHLTEPVDAGNLIMKSRALSHSEAKKHEVDGPFVILLCNDSYCNNIIRTY